jgi:hypothetical protein
LLSGLLLNKFAFNESLDNSDDLFFDDQPNFDLAIHELVEGVEGFVLAGLRWQLVLVRDVSLRRRQVPPQCVLLNLFDIELDHKNLQVVLLNRALKRHV